MVVVVVGNCDVVVVAATDKWSHATDTMRTKSATTNITGNHHAKVSAITNANKFHRLLDSRTCKYVGRTLRDCAIAFNTAVLNPTFDMVA